ncbi:MAG: hypothetical protein NTU47_17000 [Ignavibacteriales bacterium]|nr:hypothetical protein [Ignavibacteriales bacterium]
MFYLPTSQASDWQQLLADPEKHWKDGFSAKSLALSWQGANGFPQSLKRLFDSSHILRLHNLTFLAGFPEHKVDLPGGSRASQNDLFVLAGGADGLTAIMVEGKVEEPFGPFVSEWLENASAGKRERMAYLLKLLSLPESSVHNLRYQLLHRTASAILEAQRFHCTATVMLVHSFSATRTSFDDYRSFVNLFSATAAINTIVGPVRTSPMPLYLAWLSDPL